MDWPRIKTILIVVLLLTNLLLGAMIVNERQTFQRENDERMANIRELYKQKGIELAEQPRRFPEKVMSLSVEYDTYGEEELQWLLGGAYEYDGVQYTNQDEVVLLSGTTIEYYKNPHQPSDDLFSLKITDKLADSPDKKVIENTCDTFLEKLKLPKNYVYEHYLTEGQYTYVCVKQLYDDYFLDDSSMVLMLYDGEVVAFKRKWLNILGTNNTEKYDIISVDRALYMMMPNFKSGDIISEIAIGYKLNDSSLLVSELVSGEALPYYRITLDTGEAYYVQAVSETQ